MTQLRARVVEQPRMQIQTEPWGGIVVMWVGGAALLVDRRDAWFAWRGQLVGRVPVGDA